MGKFSTPDVSFQDVYAALPEVKSPLGIRIVVYPGSKVAPAGRPCVELVYTAENAATWVYKRFGAPAKSRSTAAVLTALLLAAYDCHSFCEGKSPDDLLKLVRWEVSMLR